MCVCMCMSACVCALVYVCACFVLSSSSLLSLVPPCLALLEGVGGAGADRGVCPGVLARVGTYQDSGYKKLR